MWNKNRAIMLELVLGLFLFPLIGTTGENHGELALLNQIAGP